ncbi:MAG: protein kinase [Acidobacteriota bacterium]
MPLNTGATSEVYRAYDPALQRDVALKFLRRDDPALVERMMREARAQARLKHENICQVYEIGELEGRPYIAMQFIDGEELGQVAARGMSLRDKVQVMATVAEALHTAHEAGLIHRDIKPSNIMVETLPDGRFKPVVVDFGLVIDRGDEAATAMTEDGQMLGTPPYMAPEQVQGRAQEQDARTDVYALGATFYDVILGQTPFQGVRSVELLMRVVQDEPTPPRRIDSTLPIDVQTILLTCLEKQPARRYASASALAEDLHRYLAGEPIEARPASITYRVLQQARRHRLMVTVVTVCLAIMLMLAALQSWRANQRLAHEQHYGQIGKDFDWVMRADYMSAMQDIQPVKRNVRARIAELEAELDTIGSLGRGAARYAIGRGYLTLRAYDQARVHLERAWQAGYRTPDVAYALSLSLSQQYRSALEQAQRIADPARRRTARDQAQAAYRAPTLAYLAQSQGAEGVSRDYIEAQLALYDGQFDEALRRVDATLAELPWFYEARILRGDVLQAMGARAAVDDPAQARVHYAAAEDAYEATIRSASSDPIGYVGLCALNAVRLGLEARIAAHGLPEDGARGGDEAVGGDSAAAAAALWRSGASACGDAQTIDAGVPRAWTEDVRLHLAWDAYLEAVSTDVISADASGTDASGTDAVRSDADDRRADRDEALVRALASGREGVEAQPAVPAVQRALGDVHRRRGERALQAAPAGDPRPYWALALRSYRQALRLRPDDPMTRDRVRALGERMRQAQATAAAADPAQPAASTVAVAPTDAASSVPAPTDAASSVPAPTDAVSSVPAPTDAASSVPAPTDAASSVPAPTDAASSVPAPTDAAPAISASTGAASSTGPASMGTVAMKSVALPTTR